MTEFAIFIFSMIIVILFTITQVKQYCCILNEYNTRTDVRVKL